MTLSLIWPAGLLKQVVTSITLVNNTLKTQDVAVPANKIWLLLNIRAVNPDDVDRTITFSKFKEVAKTNQIKIMASRAAGPGSTLQWPNTVQSEVEQGASAPYEIAIAGNVYTVVWAAGGASAGGTDADGLVMEYLELSV